MTTAYADHTLFKTRQTGDSPTMPAGFDGVLDGIGLSPAERKTSRLMLLDASHRVIASSDGKGACTEHYPLRPGDRSSGYYQDNGNLIAFAETPGYETYRGLGWYGCIESLQEETQQ